MAASAKFKKYLFAKNTGSISSTYNLDPASGVRYVTTDLLLQFNRMETAKRVEITALALGDLVVIAKDANGKYWYLGKDEPVNASAGDGQIDRGRVVRGQVLAGEEMKVAARLEKTAVGHVDVKPPVGRRLHEPVVGLGTRRKSAAGDVDD